MEIFDICDEQGNPLGGNVERSIAHRDGILHRTAHIWIIREYNGKKQVLLQKRSETKDSFPGKLDTSSAGHIVAGDEPVTSAIRELFEELGISAAESELHFAGTFRIKYEKEFHGKVFRDNEVAFVYVYEESVDTDKLKLQTEEVSDVVWKDVDEVVRACDPEKRDPMYCVPRAGLMVLCDYISKE